MSESTETTEAPETSNGQPDEVDRKIREALSKAGVKVADLTDEQRARALEAPKTKAGLVNGRGAKTSLVTFILEGKDSKTQTDEARAKGGKKKKAARTSTRYEDWVQPAVERGRKLSGGRPDKDTGKPVGDETMAYAGPIQHIKIRKVFGKKFGDKVTDGGTVTGGNTTPDKILELAGGEEGAMSFKMLKEIAQFKDDTKAPLRRLRPLGKEFGEDGWAKGRFLAAVLVVWIEDLKKAS